jgi:hypothetical protein
MLYRAAHLAAAAFALAVGLSPANAVTITWTFNSGTGAASSTAAQTYNADAPNSATTLTAQGFLDNTFVTPEKLYNKNTGGNEIGLGLNSDPNGQHEIEGSQVLEIVLNLAHTSMTFSMNSVDNHEGWQVYGSTSGIAGTFSLLMSNTGLLDQGLHTLDSAHGGADLFYYFAYIDDGAPSGGQGSNILLHNLSIEATTGRNGDPTPLPAALPLFGTGLGAMGLLGWRRKRKARATV